MTLPWNTPLELCSGDRADCRLIYKILIDRGFPADQLIRKKSDRWTHTLTVTFKNGEADYAHLALLLGHECNDRKMFDPDPDPDLMHPGPCLVQSAS